MAQTETNTVRLKVSPEVARIVKPGAPRDAQLAAARGALPLAGKDLLTVLFFLCSSRDAEIKKSAVKTVRELPASSLDPVLKDQSLHPQLLELLVRARLSDPELMDAVILHPSTTLKSLLYLAQKAGAEVLERLAANQNLLYEHREIVEAIIANPAAGKSLKLKLGWQEPVPEVSESTGQSDALQDPDSHSEDECDDEGRSQEELDALIEEADDEGLSKYQIALELKVAEKIKMGLTGDKEWRALMIKQSNKLIQGAVLKNPRITDGEVLMIAKNKTSSDDLIRQILLNKDWMKLYEMKKALILHPKTPAPKALRLVPFMTMKDIKELAKSRQVSTVVSTAARKELELRLKKSGG
jgi:hypothetical protein